jgi:hypothetical protein
MRSDSGPETASDSPLQRLGMPGDGAQAAFAPGSAKAKPIRVTSDPRQVIKTGIWIYPHTRVFKPIPATPPDRLSGLPKGLEGHPSNPSPPARRGESTNNICLNKVVQLIEFLSRTRRRCQMVATSRSRLRRRSGGGLRSADCGEEGIA